MAATKLIAIHDKQTLDALVTEKLCTVL